MSNSRRFRSTVVCVFYGLLFGLGFTCVIISLPFYLEDFFGPRLKHTMYGVIVAITYLPAVLCGVVGKIVDKTRNIRTIMSVLLFIVGVGNILYALHFSIWFLVIGRFLAGFGMCLRTVIAGEFARWYQDDEKGLKNALFMFNFAFTVGFVMGPASATLFSRINYRIGEWQITKDNVAGVIMGCCFLMHMIITLIFVKNISKERNLDTETPKKVSENTKLLSFKDVITDFNVMLLIIAQAWLNFTTGYNELVVLLVGQQTLEMSLTELSALILVSSLLLVGFLLTIWRKYCTGIYAFRGFVLCLFCACHTHILLLQPILFKINLPVLQDLIIVLADLGNAVTMIPSIAATRELLFAMVPNHSTGFVDGIRGSVCFLAAAVGFLLAPFIYVNLNYVVPISVVISLSLLLLLYKYI